MTTYIPTIGLEVHAELSTKSKMFCGCKNNPHEGEPNSLICPVCMAHPGTIPVPNKEAVKYILLFGKSIQGKLATYSEFDRKNYFYPDIPKAYQISQYAFPFVTGGKLAGVEITRVHLEEDTARSQHEIGDGSIVDFNRAGVPLMELVTEPVIHDAKTASIFAKEMQLLLRTLEVSNANLEKGEMRVEVNISLSTTQELGTKVEVKNINSFKAVEQAIEFEIKRQTKILEAGEQLAQETRGWNESKSVTFSQRSKESAEEYRYFPDPDIPKFDIAKIEEFDNSRLEEIMPELPNEIRISLKKIGVPPNQIEIIIAQKSFLEYFRRVTEKVQSDPKKLKIAANYLTSDMIALLQKNADSTLDITSADQFGALVAMVGDSLITSRVAKDLLQEVVCEGIDPMKVAEERGLLQTSSEDDLIPVVTAIIRDNPKVVAEYRAGKESVLQFLVGLGMKETRGGANPGVLMELIKKQLTE